MSHVVLTGLFVVLLAAGVVTDIRDRRVPNWLVLALTAVGLVSALVGVASADTLAGAFLGGLVGLALWLPFWLLGLLGAGDVKYFAGACCWLGVPLAWRAALLAALLGGVMSLVMLIYQRGFRHAAEGVALQAQHASVILAEANAGAADAKSRTFPYALPMALALLVALFAPKLLLST